MIKLHPRMVVSNGAKKGLHPHKVVIERNNNNFGSLSTVFPKIISLIPLLSTG